MSTSLQVRLLLIQQRFLLLSSTIQLNKPGKPNQDPPDLWVDKCTFVSPLPQKDALSPNRIVQYNTVNIYSGDSLDILMPHHDPNKKLDQLNETKKIIQIATNVVNSLLSYQQHKFPLNQAREIASMVLNDLDFLVSDPVSRYGTYIHSGVCNIDQISQQELEKYLRIKEELLDPTRERTHNIEISKRDLTRKNILATLNKLDRISAVALSIWLLDTYAVPFGGDETLARDLVRKFPELEQIYSQKLIDLMHANERNRALMN